ncbi:MAG: Na/Pi cotransporter family protein [Rikenellaceae bacterium]|nr:Na/Pi cotransporter family protein [Rikenellaceae bacterium]
MGNTLIQILIIVGSLGLFLFGMKLMSESLQKIAGNKLRDILASMTSNAFKCVVVGAFVTLVIQSSTATTVMVVSFVNAGLLSLVQAIGVIMGANIGTTGTAWLISIGAFSIDLSRIALPLTAFAAPLLFVKSQRWKNFGDFLFGFTLLFMGLGLLKSSINGLQDNPATLEFLTLFSTQGKWSILIFVLVGALITLIVQSSSVTMALTIIMCNNGWIPFECACAMVLGDNIGTTFTANLAAMVANTEARRAALAHLVFNLIGLVWALLVFRPFVQAAVRVMEFFGSASPLTDSHATPMALSLFHSMFNLLNTILLVAFIPQIARLVTRLIRQKEDSGTRLAYIEGGTISVSGISIIQAHGELEAYSRRTSKMFGFVRALFREEDPEEFQQTYQRIARYERISDRLESEIYNYLTQTTQDEVGSEVVKQVQMMLKVISDIEAMADCNYKLAKIIRYRRDNAIAFTEGMQEKIEGLFDLIDRAILLMNNNIQNAFTMEYPTMPEEVYLLEERINAMEEELKNRYIFEVGDHKPQRSAIVVFAELISETERLADTIEQVSRDVLNIAPHTKPALSHA